MVTSRNKTLSRKKESKIWEEHGGLKHEKQNYSVKEQGKHEGRNKWKKNNEEVEQGLGKPLTPKHLKDLDWACPSTKNMYLSYTLPLLDDYVKKNPYPKST